MAIEDAVVLGEEVAAGGSVHPRYCADSCDRRFERTRLVVETSVQARRKCKSAVCQWRSRTLCAAERSGALRQPY